jgi:hypothetical protein
MKARRTIDFEQLERLASAGASAQVIIEMLKSQEGRNAPRPKRQGRTRQDKAQLGATRHDKADQTTPSQVAEKELFKRAKDVIGKTCGGLVSSLVKFKAYDIGAARAVIEIAATKSDPREYVVACMKGKGNGQQSNLMDAFAELRAGTEGGNQPERAEPRDVTPRGG